MVLLLRRQEADGLLQIEQAIELTSAAVLEEVAGTTLHMAPFGGSGWARRIMRITGAGLYGFGRLGIRASSLSLLFDINDGKPLAIMEQSVADVRLSASVGLAARHLARPNASRVGLIGSGMISLPMLRGLCAVRPIESVAVFSPTREHREAFAERASRDLGIPVVAHAQADSVVEEADILAVATNARAPVMTYEKLRPGTHVTSAGLVGELDASVYLRADQLVAASREQEIENAKPTKTPGRITGGVLYDLFTAGSLQPESVVDLGAIVRGDVAARNGPSDINVYRDSRGGVGEAAFASWAYDRAKERGLGVEFDFD
jgi:alanine dehydrogenase